MLATDDELMRRLIEAVEAKNFELAREIGAVLLRPVALPTALTDDELRDRPNTEALSDTYRITTGPELFHYTDQNGLLRIVHGASVLLSDLRYLNDSEEFGHAVRVAEQVLLEKAQFFKSAGKPLHGSLCELLNANLARTTAIYVFSLSPRDDDLSQCRGYCPQGEFSIGFCTRRLLRLLPPGFRLVPWLVLPRRTPDEFRERNRLGGKVGVHGAESTDWAPADGSPEYATDPFVYSGSGWASQ